MASSSPSSVFLRAGVQTPPLPPEGDTCISSTAALRDSLPVSPGMPTPCNRASQALPAPSVSLATPFCRHDVRPAPDESERPSGVSPETPPASGPPVSTPLAHTRTAAGPPPDLHVFGPLLASKVRRWRRYHWR